MMLRNSRVGSWERSQGFTLIEMLVAMAIFSMLIAVLMLGFRQGLMLWEKGESASRVWQGYEFRYRLLDRLMAGAEISDSRTGAGYALPYFHGAPTGVRLLSTAPLMDVGGHVRAVELHLVKGDSGRWQLRYREAERYGDSSRGIRWPDQWVILLRDLRAASFAFEAPANPQPLALARNHASTATHSRYRSSPEWMPQYDIALLWLCPQTIRMDFIDQEGLQHHWLFALPRWPDAWAMGTYGLGTY